MKSRRTMRAEAIASFESSILQRDALDAEIQRVAGQLGELQHQRDHLVTSIETVCRLLNWTPEVAEAGFRRRIANGEPEAKAEVLSLPLLDRKDAAE